MSLAKKLNVKDGMTVCVLEKPADTDLDDLTISTSPSPGGILAFVKTLAEVDTKCAPVFEVAKKDGLAWIAYPKAKQLGTDLNRDILWQHLRKQGIQGVRQISIDDVWSAMRFRPGSEN